MRVAALYDVHGNLAALDAVLAELERDPVDAIVIGGDVVTGPHPRETLARLRALPGEVHWVRGNHDREVADEAALAAESWPLAPWAAHRLEGEEREWLAARPFHVELDLPLGHVLFCHATPRSDTEIVTILAPEEVYAGVVANVDAALLVVGHTHQQDDRHVGALRYVNAGSVGMPFEGRRGAFWALLGDGVDHRVTAYDADAAVATFPPEMPDEGDSFRGCVLGTHDRLEVAREFERQAGR